MKQIALVVALVTLCQFSIAIQTNVQVKPSLKKDIINLKKDPALFSRSYESVINKLVPLNALIPAIEKQTVRIMSYNVHRFSNAHKKPTEHEMVNIIQTINPTIVILQEAENNHPIIKKLKQLGYSHQVFGAIDSSNYFGNMILSKIPLTNSKTYQFASNKRIKMGRNRSFVRTEIDLSSYKKTNLVLYATHLAIYTQVNGYNPKNTNPDREIRLEQARELIEQIKAHDFNKNVIIAGDFNDDARSDVWQYLLKHRFSDCLSALDTGHLFTSLYGQRIDFIKTRLHDISLIGCYMYFSSASDHLPIFVDIAL